MAIKIVQIDGLGSVKLQKRRGTRNMRVSVGSDGSIRVGLPTWVPYEAGVVFAKQHKDWIAKHQTKQTKELLASGSRIGKAHTLITQPAAANKSIRVTVVGTEIRIHMPPHLTSSNSEVQKAMQRGAIKALTLQAANLLPRRLADLARQHGFTYKNVRVKPMKSRWGSCDQASNIVLNIYLMQLPWNLIDYVLLHELIHTQVHRHGTEFWSEFGKVLPHAKQLSKQLKTHHPVVTATPSMA